MPTSLLRVQLGFWALVFALRQVPGTLAAELTGQSQFVFNLLWAGTGLTCSTLCYRALIRPHAEGRVGLPRWTACAALLACALLMPAVLVTWFATVPIRVPGASETELIWLFLGMRGADAAVPAVAWCMTIAATLAVSRAARAESQRLGAQLELERQAKSLWEFRLGALQARVHPHFLFNAMNTIRALIAEQPELARGAVTDLAFLMRQTLNVSEAREHALEAELRIVRAYLALERLRFGERLDWRMADTQAHPGLRLPPLLLQTLVENAVIHGVGRQTGTVEIDIMAGMEAGWARLEVVNSCDRAPAPADTGRGLALSRERLRLLYGEDSAVTLTWAEGRTTARAEWRPRDTATATDDVPGARFDDDRAASDTLQNGAPGERTR